LLLSSASQTILQKKAWSLDPYSNVHLKKDEPFLTGRFICEVVGGYGLSPLPSCTQKWTFVSVKAV